MKLHADQLLARIPGFNMGSTIYTITYTPDTPMTALTVGEQCDISDGVSLTIWGTVVSDDGSGHLVVELKFVDQSTINPPYQIEDLVFCTVVGTDSTNSGVIDAISMTEVAVTLTGGSEFVFQDVLLINRGDSLKEAAGFAYWTGPQTTRLQISTSKIQNGFEGVVNPNQFINFDSALMFVNNEQQQTVDDTGYLTLFQPQTTRYWIEYVDAVGNVPPDFPQTAGGSVSGNYTVRIIDNPSPTGPTGTMTINSVGKIPQVGDRLFGFNDSSDVQIGTITPITGRYLLEINTAQLAFNLGDTLKNAATGDTAKAINLLSGMVGSDIAPAQLLTNGLNGTTPGDVIYNSTASSLNRSVVAWDGVDQLEIDDVTDVLIGGFVLDNTSGAYGIISNIVGSVLTITNWNGLAFTATDVLSIWDYGTPAISYSEAVGFTADIEIYGYVVTP